MSEVITFLRTHRSYRRLLYANFISGIGDWFSTVAVMSLLLHLTGSGLAIGITLAVRTLPYLVMGPIGGILADRISKKTILIISDFARVVLALSFLLVRSPSQVWIIYTSTLGLVIFSALFSPARTAIIPQLVPSKYLLMANSLEQSMSGLVMTLGSALGGLATAAFGTDVAFILNATSFLVSGLICWSIYIPRNNIRSQVTRSEEHSTERNLAKPPKSSLWGIFRQSRLIQILSLQSFLWPIGGGTINVLISIYGFQVFHAGNRGVGILYAALGIGFLISGFIAKRFTTWMVQVAIVGLVIEGLSHILFSQSLNIWMAAFFLVIATIGAGVGNASSSSLVMRSIPKQVQGRVFSLFDTTSNVTISLSMMLTGILLDYISPRILGFVAGTLIVFTGLTGLGLLRIQLPTDSEDTTSTASDTSSDLSK